MEMILAARSSIKALTWENADFARSEGLEPPTF